MNRLTNAWMKNAVGLLSVTKQMNRPASVWMLDTIAVLSLKRRTCRLNCYRRGHRTVLQVCLSGRLATEVRCTNSGRRLQNDTSGRSLQYCLWRYCVAVTCCFSVACVLRTSTRSLESTTRNSPVCHLASLFTNVIPLVIDA